MRQARRIVRATSLGTVNWTYTGTPCPPLHPLPLPPLSRSSMCVAHLNEVNCTHCPAKRSDTLAVPYLKFNFHLRQLCSSPSSSLSSRAAVNARITSSAQLINSRSPEQHQPQLSISAISISIAISICICIGLTQPIKSAT